MKINTAISELWKSGFFLKHRKPSDVKSKLFDEYQITASNVSMQLKSCKKLFYDKHYAQTIFEAFKKVNNLVKEKSYRKDLDGKNLMLTAFSVNNPIIKMNGLVSQSDKDEQEGFMRLYAGAIMGIRNPKGHENIVQKDKNRTLKYLIFASLLCERLEECNTMVN